MSVTDSNIPISDPPPWSTKLTSEHPDEHVVGALVAFEQILLEGRLPAAEALDLGLKEDQEVGVVLPLSKASAKDVPVLEGSGRAILAVRRRSRPLIAAVIPVLPLQDLGRRAQAVQGQNLVGYAGAVTLASLQADWIQERKSTYWLWKPSSLKKQWCN